MSLSIELSSLTCFQISQGTIFLVDIHRNNIVLPSSWGEGLSENWNLKEVRRRRKGIVTMGNFI